MQEWSEVKVRVSQLCLTLCDPMVYTVHGILQARIFEWVTFPFSRGASQPKDWTQVVHIAGGFLTRWATREAWVHSLGWVNPLDKGMATHSGILPWRIPWTEEPGGLQSTGSDMTEWLTLSLFNTCSRWVTHFVSRSKRYTTQTTDVEKATHNQILCLILLKKKLVQNEKQVQIFIAPVLDLSCIPIDFSHNISQRNLFLQCFQTCW